MTSYNGQALTYDSIGNPLTYNNGTAYTFTWEGRQMQTAKKGNTTWTYTYNSDGLRTSKSNGNVTYTYAWNENRQLQSMTWNAGYAVFSYDANGVPYSVRNYDAIYDVERTYLYITNVQGDVLSVIDSTTGQTAVSYKYDAWGKLISKSSTSTDYATIYEFNPLTYRGYIYDSETGFYYLQSRYYDPSVGRFLNADDANLIDIDANFLSCNLFVCCYNSHPNYVDPMGTSPLQAILAAVFGVVGFIIGDYIARGCGLSPSGIGAWKYWLLRSAVALGGAALGWFAGGLITKLLINYLSKNPQIMLKLSSKMGAKFIVSALNFLGINPIGLMGQSLLMGFLQTVFNNPNVTMPSAWVKLLLPIAEKYGWIIRLDSGHIGTAWNFVHLHIGKVHIAIAESIISFIIDFLKG